MVREGRCESGVIQARPAVHGGESVSDLTGQIAARHGGAGAELSVSFKDGVPNYIVRAHGDTLEMVLAKSSAHGDKTEAHAKKKHNGRAEKKH